jgi:putative transposase
MTQKCSGCSEIVPKFPSERIHVCNKCGLEIDRDVNAARNILALVLEWSLTEDEPLLIHKRISKFIQGSEKSA